MPIPVSGLSHSLRESRPAVSGNGNPPLLKDRVLSVLSYLDALPQSSQQSPILQLRKLRPKATQLFV